MLTVVPVFLMAIYGGCRAQYFSYTDTMSIEDTSGSPNDTVAVTFDLTNSFVVGGFLVRVAYDDTAFSALDMELGSHAQSLNLYGAYLDRPGIASFYGTSWDPIHNFIPIGSGAVAILHFMILPSASSGAYSVSFQDTDTTSHENSLSNIWGDSLVIPILVDGEIEVSGGVGVGNEAPTPSGFALAQNYPNPFNGTTRISFTLDRAQDVDLTVFDLLGRPVATVFSGRARSGENIVYWDARVAGASLASGTYFYRLKGQRGRGLTKMMTLLK
jgi:hypothetical protein